jgi:hypothetical protein
MLHKNHIHKYIDSDGNKDDTLAKFISKDERIKNSVVFVARNALEYSAIFQTKNM